MPPGVSLDAERQRNARDISTITIKHVSTSEISIDNALGWLQILNFMSSHPAPTGNGDMPVPP